LALKSVPVLAHFGAQTSVRRRADQRVEIATVEDLEVSPQPKPFSPRFNVTPFSVV